MNHLETVLSLLTLAFELGLCTLVYLHRVQRVLPFFAAYATLLLVNTVGVWIVYQTFGFQSLPSYFCGWGSLVLNGAMRSLAIAELCRYKLRNYQGIWGLAWRFLVAVAAVFVVHAAVDAWGQPNRLAIYALTFDRDLDIAAVAILAALLLIHNYYGLSLEPLQQKIASGICFVCGVDVFGDSVLRSLFTGYLFPIFAAKRVPFWSNLQAEFERVQDIYSTIHLLCFMAAMGIWCYAVYEGVPKEVDAPVLLPAHVYRELSPAINLRLNSFNDRLVELLKP